MEIPGLDPVREHFNLFQAPERAASSCSSETSAKLWYHFFPFFTFQGWVVVGDSSRGGTWGLLWGLQLPNTLGIQVNLLLPLNIYRLPGKVLPQWPLLRASPSSRSSLRISEKQRSASLEGWMLAGVCGSTSMRRPKCPSYQCMASSPSNWGLIWESQYTPPQVFSSQTL